jgi:hypothetical protein
MYDKMYPEKEKEREALMRLSMCAARRCTICTYRGNAWDQCLIVQAGCVNVLYDAVFVKEKPRETVTPENETV